MKLRLLSMAGFVALTSAFVIAGCGDDDSVDPATGGATSGGKGGGGGKAGSAGASGKGGTGETGGTGTGGEPAEEGGTGGTVTAAGSGGKGGSTAAGAGGSTAGSGGKAGSAGTGGTAGVSGGSTGGVGAAAGYAGIGGTSPTGGAGGSTAGAGGSTAGAGGSTAGAGGSTAGAGGSTAGAGGSAAGAGGSTAGAGGSTAGAGGAGGSGGSGGGSTNLIPDGTFETGQGQWGSYNFTTPVAVTNTAAHGGTNSLMAATAAVNANISRSILGFVAVGKKYTATAYARVTDASTALKFQITLGCNGRADDYPVVAWNATPTANTWIALTGTVDLTVCKVDASTTDALTTLQKVDLFVGKDVGDLYVDDVSLVLLP